MEEETDEDMSFNLSYESLRKIRVHSTTNYRGEMRLRSSLLKVHSCSYVRSARSTRRLCRIEGSANHAGCPLPIGNRNPQGLRHAYRGARVLRRDEAGAGALGGGACTGGCSGFAASAKRSGVEVDGAGCLRRNSIELPVPISITRQFSSVTSRDRTMCGAMANTISFSRRSLLSCAKRYLRIGILLIHG